ncbi:hypothetical protein SDC9_198729 [bioreactor metagenome]|uniref:Uncharacterized protein n=1 Tax=bioreactor metagenome TaxID=1076179 RepID=A0A645IIG2_9ZZZZ
MGKICAAVWKIETQTKTQTKTQTEAAERTKRAGKTGIRADHPASFPFHFLALIVLMYGVSSLISRRWCLVGSRYVLIRQAHGGCYFLPDPG